MVGFYKTKGVSQGLLGRVLRRYLSHLSLLFRQGSQLIALRARFVGGRPSAFCSAEPGGGEVR